MVGHRAIMRNVSGMLVTNVARKATTFVIYILAARYLGAHGFGQLALATTLLYSWQQFALCGLHTYITRELSRDRSLTPKLFLHSTIIGILTSTLGIGILILFVNVADYDYETRKVIYLVAIGLIPLVLSQLSEGVFLGWERSDLSALIAVPMCLLKLLATLLTISFSRSICDLALCLSCVHLLEMFVQWIVLTISTCVPRFSISWAIAFDILRSSSVFLGIQGTLAVRSASLVTLLSLIEGETAVGIFVAANQLLSPLTLILSSIGAALFPAMCRSHVRDSAQLVWIVRNLAESLWTLVLPCVVGIFMLSNEILALLYEDNQFELSAMVLRIVIWSLLARVFTTILGQVLWASSCERQAFLVAALNTTIYLIMGIFLIENFGVIGAAANISLLSTINVAQHIFAVRSLMPSGSWLIAGLQKPALASAIMATFIMAFKDLNLAALVIISGILYAIAVTMLHIASAGGITQLREKLLRYGIF